jgi:hypothetical protein
MGKFETIKQIVRVKHCNENSKKVYMHIKPLASTTASIQDQNFWQVQISTSM